jgi:HEPN domain-containing protein
MIRFYAGLVVIFGRDIANEIGVLAFEAAEGHGETTIASLPQDARDGIANALTQLVEDPKEMPLPQKMRRKVERLKSRVQNANDPITVKEAMALLKELHNDIIDELSSPYFLMIPTERRLLYEQSQPPFGENVAAAFPQASYDIAAASRLLALDEWTAAVFHLMRAVELALRLLARRLKIRKVETKEWATLMDDFDKALAAMRQRKRTAMRDRKLQYYSEARAHFGVFKDAWRNHVMHSRATYDERQAFAIFNSVRSFMDELARGAPR